MKRLALGALGVGLALAAVAAPVEAQAVRVGVGVNLPRVGVRFEYGPNRGYPVRRIYRYDSRGFGLNLAYMTRLERELYHEWLAFEYRRWLRHNRRIRFRSQRAWERHFLRDQRRAERVFRKWLRDFDYDRMIERERLRERSRFSDSDRNRDGNRPRVQTNRGPRNRIRGR
jgi:hypothetical protein